MDFYLSVGDRVYSLDRSRRGAITSVEFRQTPSPYEDLWLITVAWDDGSTGHLYDDHVIKLTPLELLAEI